MLSFSTCPDPGEYGIGFPAVYDPAREVFRNMLRLVAYDVADARRLRKVSAVCRDYGLRIEYSVFDFTKLHIGKFFHLLDPGIYPHQMTSKCDL